MIEQARQNALQSVNAELIKLYWNVGEYLSGESVKTAWGDAFIDETARYIKENCPGIKGFTRRGLYRMRQFYETYKGNEFVSPLVTQISWTHHLIIMSGAKSIEEKEFYIALCVKEKYSKRELERQLQSAYYQRYMLSTRKPAPVDVPHDENARFLDSYVLEFLDLPDKYSEGNGKRCVECIFGRSGPSSTRRPGMTNPANFPYGLATGLFWMPNAAMARSFSLFF
ncbi:MAG: DUF1016 N-terminal domain-containing protein, partial [Peptococcaceae bacterium]|nr:DUF1016 N-terminal domain-containing protein [Peptococcaceae bacterium]